MGQNQFSLRAIFVATAIVGVVLAITIHRGVVIQALPTIPFALIGACIGSGAGRLIGTDYVDATIGGVLGAIAGAAFGLLGPRVE